MNQKRIKIALLIVIVLFIITLIMLKLMRKENGEYKSSNHVDEYPRSRVSEKMK